MRRREFLALLGGIALARPTAALGQEAVRRMGMLMPFAEDDPEAVIRVAAFRQKLRELGWAVGRGLRRLYGRPQRRVAALTAEHLAAIVTSLGPSIKDVRDRALLLVGFAGAFRRCELSALDCGSLVRTTKGIVITIPRSKTDQEGQGRKIDDLQDEGTSGSIAMRPPIG